MCISFLKNVILEIWTVQLNCLKYEYSPNVFVQFYIDYMCLFFIMKFHIQKQINAILHSRFLDFSFLQLIKITVIEGLKMCFVKASKIKDLDLL